MNSLYDIKEDLKDIYEKLHNGEGVDAETGEVMPEMLVALKTSKQELQDKAVDYCYIIKSFDDEIDIYDKEIKRLQDRKKRMQNTQKRLKEAVSQAMQEFGIVKIKGKTLSISFKESESVEILDESLILPKFFKTKTEISVDKIAIKEAIKNGEEVQGVMLVKNNNLQIK